MVIRGFFFILMFLVLGNICSTLSGHFIPGSVIGMILFYLALQFKLIKAESVKAAADFLTGNMTVFFIPASIGIMKQWNMIGSHLIAWLAVTFISTVMVLLSAGLAHDGIVRLGQLVKNKEKK